jgi:hypothetical protein
MAALAVYEMARRRHGNRLRRLRSKGQRPLFVPDPRWDIEGGVA